MTVAASSPAGPPRGRSLGLALEATADSSEQGAGWGGKLAPGRHESFTTEKSLQ